MAGFEGLVCKAEPPPDPAGFNSLFFSGRVAFKTVIYELNHRCYEVPR